MTMQRIEKHLCKYVFNQAEKREISEALARGIEELKALKIAKKQAMAKLKAEIDDKEELIYLDARNLYNGFEMRNLDCEVHVSSEEGVIYWRRVDNGEIVQERSLTEEERQIALPGMGGLQ